MIVKGISTQKNPRKSLKKRDKFNLEMFEHR